MVLFLRNKRFNFMLFWGDYYLRRWRLPIEERACRKTDLGGGDYYLRNSGLPPLLKLTFSFWLACSGLKQQKYREQFYLLKYRNSYECKTKINWDVYLQ